MKNIFFTLVLLSSFSGVFAQLVDAHYYVRVNHIYHSNCYENSVEEWTGYAKFKDDVNSTYVSSGCQTCDSDNNCTYANNVSIGDRINSSKTLYFAIKGWEDDRGGRCNYDVDPLAWFLDDDDCLEQGNGSVNYRASLPQSGYGSAGYLTDFAVTSGGFGVFYDVYWFYSGSNSSISTSLSVQSSTQFSGNITSHSVNLIAGKTYRFETTSGNDPFLRLYSSNGYSVVAIDDNSGIGNYAKILYTPNVSGVYYIETSESDRDPLSANTTLEYQEYSTVINQDCANATFVGNLSTTTGNTAGTIVQTAPICNGISNGTGGGLWYKIRGTGATATVMTDAGFDTKLRVFKGDCNNFVCVAGNDDIDQWDPNSMVEFCTEQDEIYYILVSGYQAQEGSFYLEVELYIPVMGMGFWNVSADYICKGTEVTISTWGGLEDKWWTGGYEQTQIDTGAVLVVTPNQTTTYYQTIENECGKVFYMGEKEIYVNGSNVTPDINTNLVEDSAIYTCVVNDNEWHYFYSEYDQLLGAINSHNQDLGNVTITAKPHDFSLFGIGNCSNTTLNNGEFSLPRNWEITGTNAITSPVDIVFYYESNEVQELTDTIANLTNNVDYVACWGDVTGESDLMMTIENTDGTTAEFVALNPTAGPAGGQRKISFQISKYGKGRLHSNGSLSSVEASDLNNIISGFYPNPTKNETQLSYRLTQRYNLNIQIFDGVGRLVDSRDVSSANNVGSVSFNTEAYSNGIYTARIVIDNQTITRKLVISK